IPLGLAAGRWGNFMNGELWGRTTDLPWGMVFPHAAPMPRHPSQLYEMLLEGFLLFALLWWVSAKPRRRGEVRALCVSGYGRARFLVESARQTEGFVGAPGGGRAMCKLLSMPMVLAGILLWARAGRSSPAPTG